MARYTDIINLSKKTRRTTLASIATEELKWAMLNNGERLANIAPFVLAVRNGRPVVYRGIAYLPHYPNK